jgi:hypothetical protein
MGYLQTEGEQLVVEEVRSLWAVCFVAYLLLINLPQFASDQNISVDFEPTDTHFRTHDVKVWI